MESSELFHDDHIVNIIDDSQAHGTLPSKESDGMALVHGNSLDNGNVDEIVPDPRVGMVFETEKAAFDYYNQYARKVGFSVRWTTRTLNRKTGLMVTRKFVCSKEGHNGDGKAQDLFARYRREGTRCGCSAFMKIKLGSNSKYLISKFNATHNHELATPNYVHMLRSQRDVPSTQSGVAKKKKKRKKNTKADDYGNSRTAPIATTENMIQPADSHEEIGLQVDCRNYLQTKRLTSLHQFDAAGLLDYFRIRQAQDPSFFYSFQFDVDEQITNAFWADGKMKTDFMHFSDVVCLDTTYKTNDYGRPLALFVGVNNHKQSIIFGAALLYDETVNSFRWIFKTLLEAMSGKFPTTILTDEIEEILEAIELELPYTSHRQCVWQLYQNAFKYLAHIFSRSKNFDEDFSKCLFDYEVETAFLDGWNSMLVKYNLFDDLWLQHKFEEREKWAIAYARSIFCADMKNTQRLDCLNKNLKSYLFPAENILGFFGCFEKFLANRRNQELEANFRMTQSQPCVPPVSIIKHAARIYTSSVFYMFMAEYVHGLECLIKNEQDDGSAQILTVNDGRHPDHIVKINLREQSLSCSCRKFEFAGILCAHVLSCITNYLRSIPVHYILSRWTRAACTSSDFSISAKALSGTKLICSQRYDILIRDYVPLLVRASEDDVAFNCALKHKSLMYTEIESIGKEQSVYVPLSTSESMYYVTQTRNAVNEVRSQW